MQSARVLDRNVHSSKMRRAALLLLMLEAASADLVEKYKDHGLVVIGVHTPEFAFERNINNVRAAVSDLKIEYPLAHSERFSLRLPIPQDEGRVDDRAKIPVMVRNFEKKHLD
jgi:hypothetical protein